MTELPEDLLRRWPGRFRFGALLTRLAQPGAVDDAAVTDAVLAGIAAGRDEDGVLDQLLDDGQFEVVEEVLTLCAAIDEAHAAAVAAELEPRRADRLLRLSERLQRLDDLADAAGLELEADPDLDRGELERQARRAWPLVAARLDEADERLAKRIADRAKALQGRLRAAGLDDTAAGICGSLIAAGHLREAEFLLDHGDAQLSGPAAVPALPALPWRDVDPEEVLAWHLDPARPRPLNFPDWVPGDDAGRRLLVQVGALAREGAVAAARGFAEALDGFLNPSAAPPTPAEKVDGYAGGFLTRLHHVFADPQTTRFRPTGTIGLFVAGPGTTMPPDLPGLGPFVAVGSSFNVSDQGTRGDGAVLGLADLLRLATAGSRRPVSLLRILGRQWPLAAFSAGSPADLERLLGEDEVARLSVLSWLVDLAGLGDPEVAGALAFQTGLDARLLHLLLDLLARPDAPSSPVERLELIRQWPRDKLLAPAVEDAVLHPIRSSPRALAAFWAALEVGSADGPVTRDEMIRVAAVAATDPIWDGELDLEVEIGAGLAELAALWLVREVGEDFVRLRRCGILISLSGWAQERLAAALDRLAGQAARALPASRSITATRWQAYRYALSANRSAFDALLDSDQLDAEAIEAAIRAMAAEYERILETSPQVAGWTDLAEVASTLHGAFIEQHPAITLTIESPPGTAVAVAAPVVQVLLYELLTNAAEALGEDEGTVTIAVRPTDGDVVVDVLDNGPGVAIDEGSEYRIFREGVTTRGPGRGRGLHVARRLALRAGGDLVLRAQSGSHPILRGAHFRLILPEAAPEGSA